MVRGHAVRIKAYRSLCHMHDACVCSMTCVKYSVVTIVRRAPAADVRAVHGVACVCMFGQRREI